MYNWPRGATDNASAYGAEDCRFESCRGHLILILVRKEFEEKLSRNLSKKSWTQGVVMIFFLFVVGILCQLQS